MLLYFFPSLNTRNQFFLFFCLFFFYFWFFRPKHIFTFSLPLFSPPFSFFPFISPLLFLYSLSLSLSLSLSPSLNVPALLPGSGHWCGGPREHFRPDLCAFWCVRGCAAPPSLSHSGLFICDMHFGITHLVPHHCTPALIVSVGEIHSITVEERLPFSGLAVSLDAFTP